MVILDINLQEKLCIEMIRSMKIVFGTEMSLEQVKQFIVDQNDLDLKTDPYSKKMFECSKIDFEAFKLLKKENQYAIAAYHLQQCIEKLTKAYGLFSGYVTREELTGKHGIGHISPKMFAILLGKKSVYNRVDILLSISKSGYNLNEQQQKFNSLINQPNQLVNLSQSEIYEIIDFFKYMYRKIKHENKRNLKWKLDHFAISFNTGIKKQFSEDEAESILALNRFMNYVALKNLDVPFVFMNLSILSIITYPHAYNRYPKEKDTHIDFLDYKKGMGIIDSFDKIEYSLNIILLRTEELIKKLNFN